MGHHHRVMFHFSIFMIVFLSAFSEQSCSPNRFYCGSQVPLIPSIVQNKTLWQCGTDGKSFKISLYCKWGCKIIKDDNSYCLCLVNFPLCGHELNDIGWRGYENHSLYKCDYEGINASLIENCPDQCKVASPSHCSSQCQDGKNYCGYRLKDELGWDGYENDTLYHCHNGNETKVTSKCPPGMCYSDYCKCNPGQYYCGHELYDQLGWDTFESRPTELHKCLPNGTTIGIAFCNQCNNTPTALIVSGDQRPTCECKTGSTYCGNTLQAMGWDGYDNEALYLCEKGQNGTYITKLIDCGDGKCRGHQCECTREKLYCGHELYQMGWRQLTSAKDQAQLGRCTNGSYVAWIASCDNCITTETGSKCECSSGSHYCGHELLKWGWDGYENNTLYQCDGSFNVKNAKTCLGECVLGKMHSSCRGECVHDTKYCGYRLLKELGWNGYENDTLYHCRGGNETRILSKCAPGMCSSHYCKCNQGQYYCGHELFEQLGWTSLKSSQHELWKCAPNGRATWIADCNQCTNTGTALIVSGDQHLTCKCITGYTYCGYTLQVMGWDGYDNDTLYLCEQGQNNSYITALMACGDGKCRDNQCECTRDKLYCGHQLYKMGWRKLITSVRRQAWLYRCTTGTKVSWIASCGVCNNTGTVSKCDCTPGIMYCGSRINQIGYKAYTNDSIYICKNDLSLIDSGETNVLCSQGCTPGRSYCGYEVQYIWDIEIDDLQARYVCNQNKTRDRSSAQCTTCISNDHGAYCQCIPGWRYCASTLFMTGWNGFDKTISHIKNFTNDSVFLCKDEENVEYIETCAMNECQEAGGDWGTAAGSAHCLCSTNRTYCGHELYERYNSVDTYLHPHYIYRCSRTKQSVIEQKKCANCYRLAGVPTCRQECSIGQYYCGSDLLLLEGWQKSDALPNWLYRCDNSTTAQPIEECLAGCVSNSSESRQDAFCTPYSTPWYWFFGGVAVPLVVIGLGFLLIRILLKHRRLKKFLEEQRIDVSQLAVIKPLGEGEFGEVWQGTYRNTDSILRDVALKLSKEKNDAASKLACANCFLQEVVALDIVSHKNIIKVFGICLNFKDQFGNTVPALVLEYMNSGSAICYMRSERNRLNGQDLVHIFMDICQAGDHLCKLGIIHRDIGARNVLVQKDPHTGHVEVAKLTDFGLAKDIGKLTSMYKATNLDRNMFHFRYTAPEGFRGCFCSKSDVWSFGVFMWELYTVMEEEDALADLRLEQGRSGPVPYSELDTVAYVLAEAFSERKLKQPRMAPEKMYKIMRQCWETEEDLRPSFEELIKFFNSNCDGSEIKPKVSAVDIIHKDSDPKTGENEKQMEHNAVPYGYVCGSS